MKQIMKRRVAAALAAVMAVSMCAMFTGCDSSGSSSTTDSTPIATLPTQTTDTTTGETPVETTTGSSATETTTGGTQTPVTPVGKYTNPLTGEPTVNDVSNLRPLAIVVDNNATALENQTGLDQADVLYEALVAPGITRFLAVYADYTLVDSVCNIRSGRDYHLDWATYHNAVLMCHGASNTDNYDFYQLAVDRLGNRWGFIDTQFEYFFSSTEAGVKYGTIANWGDRYDLKYDTIFKPAALSALLNSSTSHFIAKAGGTMKGYAKQALKFVPYGTTKDMTGASNASTINLSFTCQGSAAAEKVSFAYDAATGKYLRYQDGAKHVDSETGAQLAFTNVVTLITSVECVETGIANDPYMTLVETKNLNGLGYYFHNGKVIQIKWYSDGNNLTLIDALGNDLTLATGNTYIGYLDSALVANGQFWN